MAVDTHLVEVVDNLAAELDTHLAEAAVDILVAVPGIVVGEDPVGVVEIVAGTGLVFAEPAVVAKPDVAPIPRWIARGWSER